MANPATIPAAFLITALHFLLSPFGTRPLEFLIDKTHSPLARRDKYLSYHLCFLLTLIVLLIRIRFPTKNIKVVTNGHIERTAIGMAKQVKEGPRGKRQGGKGLRPGTDHILLLTNRYSTALQPG